MSRAGAQKAIYASLFVVLAASAGLFLSQFGLDARPWERFTYAYLLLLVVYTWYLFVLLLIADLRPPRYPAYAGEPVAVVVPCFNEDPARLVECIDSVLASNAEVQVVLIDDGSTNGIGATFDELTATRGIVVHRFPENRGKREALHWATSNLGLDIRFVVTIDSDTVLDPDAIPRVVEPLKQDRIGAATGNVLLLNERENLLTRMIGTYYWVGLNVYKRAQSAISSVVCCSGCIAAYRADLLREVIDEFASQTFLGEACTHSEDRHLTNLVLRRGWKVVYVDDAISWTETPATVRGFLRQQRRWKRGYIRESIYTLTYAWRNRRLLFLQILFWDLTAPFLSFGLRISLILTAVTDPRLVLVVILPSWIVLMLVRYVFVPIRARDKLPGLFLYMLFYEVCLYWLNIYALFTVKNRSWVTRQSVAQA